MFTDIMWNCLKFSNEQYVNAMEDFQKRKTKLNDPSIERILALVKFYNNQKKKKQFEKK